MSAPTNTQRGRDAEDQAARHLQEKGHQILERNLRVGRNEIDLITDDGGILVFVEVKSKASHDFGTPEKNVDRKKRQRLIQAAAGYLQQFGGNPPRARFDVVAISGTGEKTQIRHYENAFEARRDARRGGPTWQVD
jgi:putative endonuclease